MSRHLPKIFLTFVKICILSGIATASPTKKYDFTTDWVARSASDWKRELSEFIDQPGVKALEIGSFEGRSALWFLENILTHPTSSITCIDTFGHPGIEERFDKNLKASGLSSKMTKIKKRSQVALRTLKPKSYDFVYIDGGHYAPVVLLDTVLSWGLIKNGGIIIFDDYRLIPEEGRSELSVPGMAVDAFLSIFKDHLDVLMQDYQMIVRKKKRASK